ncbi:MAG: ester cyclase [Caldilineaceae bacterium]
MPIDIHQHNRELIGKLRAALYDTGAAVLPQHLRAVFAPDCAIHLTFPFEDLRGPDALFAQAYQPLLTAMPDLERRDFIVIAGASQNGNWVGCAGHYMGVFAQPWLDIPPTQHLAAMRYHEFFRIEDEQIVEMQAVWDIPQLMMQANAWPMTPSLGVEWLVPGPATGDGLMPMDSSNNEANLALVLGMLTAMGKHPRQGGPEIMQLERFWHPQFCWYGPAGIGSMRGIHGFRHWHQIPFLKALPDRHGAETERAIFFAEGAYVGTTGWPNMAMTISGDGWLGIAPANQSITMRSLDFWRCEKGMIRENWVLIDLLHVYHQIGVDVFTRMREMTYARQGKFRGKSD